MNNEGLKNIVLLKDLPSNIIEEAIIVLKENKKIHKYQKIIERQNKNAKDMEEKEDKNKQENKRTKKHENNKVINENDYIIKEAYMLLDDYTKKLEKETPKWKNNLKKLEKRYKISVKINIGLLSIIILGVILNCFKII